MEILRQPVNHSSAWTGEAMRGTRSWTIQWPAAVVAEVESAAEGLRASGTASPAFRHRDFPLPRAAAFLADVMHDVYWERGFVLLRGLPIHKYEPQLLRDIYWGLGCHWGTPITQNAAGDAFAELADHGRPSIADMARWPHSDPCDVAAVLCVCPARQGGSFPIASSMAIYNRLLETRPEGLECLYRGFHHYLRGGETPQAPFGCTPVPIPVYRHYRGVLSCVFNASSAFQAAQRMGHVLPDEELALLDYIIELAHDDEFRLDMALQPGDIQLLNNHTVLHWRTPCRNWPEPQRKRCLLRLWIDRSEGRPIDPDFRRGYITGANVGLPVLPIQERR
jgi:hypothetical protein